jgi:hypothetical protein
MAAAFDDLLFNKSTFADLGAANQLPSIVINATNLSSRRTFTFTDDEFWEHGSRLDTFPVSLAVAASAAFPGLLHNLTLHNYREFRGPHGAGVAVLMDAGIADNLGLGTLVEMARSSFAISWGGRNPPDLRADGPRGCLLILANAELSPFARGPIRGGKDSVLDLFVSRNVLEFSDVLFAAQGELREKQFGPAVIGGLPLPLKLFEDDPVTRKRCGRRCACLVWHVALGAGITRFVQGQEDSNYLLALHHLVNKMPTRFFLKGPKGCSTANNQDALFEAARALVREDVEAVRQVCDWMAKRGLKPSGCIESSKQQDQQGSRARPALCRIEEGP